MTKSYFNLSSFPTGPGRSCVENREICWQAEAQPCGAAWCMSGVWWELSNEKTQGSKQQQLDLTWFNHPKCCNFSPPKMVDLTAINTEISPRTWDYFIDDHVAIRCHIWISPTNMVGVIGNEMKCTYQHWEQQEQRIMFCCGGVMWCAKAGYVTMYFFLWPESFGSSQFRMLSIRGPNDLDASRFLRTGGNFSS
jgi:hypothetical protein